MSRKQVAALVGLRPMTSIAASSKDAVCIWGGRARVRHVLYMAALSASNLESCTQSIPRSPRATGKKPKVVIVR